MIALINGPITSPDWFAPAVKAVYTPKRTNKYFIFLMSSFLMYFLNIFEVRKLINIAIIGTISQKLIIFIVCLTFNAPPAPTPVPITLPTKVKAAGIGYFSKIPPNISMEAVISVIEARNRSNLTPVINPFPIVLATAPPWIVAPKNAEIPTINVPFSIPTTPADVIGPNEGDALFAPITHDVINAPKKVIVSNNMGRTLSLCG